MISQVEGLARALDLDYFHEKIELNIPWNLIPPTFTPTKKFVFKNKITEVVFDRNGNPYHGRVKAVADAAREAGLKF